MADGTTRGPIVLPVFTTHGHRGPTLEGEIPSLTVTATGQQQGQMVGELPSISVEATGLVGTLVQDGFALPAIAVTCRAGESESIELPLLSVTASGKANIIGEATFSLPSLTIAGKNGLNASIDLPLTGVTAHGLVGMIGEGDFSIPVFDLTATGHSPMIGRASISLPKLALTANGGQKNFATASISIPMLKASPHGYVGSLASATITLPALELDGNGIIGTRGTASVTLPLLEVTGNVPEVVILVDINGDSESLTGYALVMNLRNQGLTEYDNYGFNSFCHFNGRYLGASSTGIFNLTGRDDNGTKIRAKARTGLQDGGTALRKGIEDVFLGISADDAMTARVVTDGYETFDGSTINPRKDEVVTERVKFGKGIRSRYLGIEIENRAGCDFTLESAELVIVPLTRKL